MTVSLPPGVEQLIDLAIEEDLGRGDITSVGLENSSGRAVIEARQELVVSGGAVAKRVFEKVDGEIRISELVPDGTALGPKGIVMKVEGPAGSILMAERTALNFLQRLCGIATQSRAFAKKVEGLDTRIVDTRKTTPGYRYLEKAAVRAGGCFNHRYDLGSGVLIKDNHLAAHGSVAAAVAAVKGQAPHGLRIEVEVETPEQLKEAIAAGADGVLLDNMTPGEVEECVGFAHGKNVWVEVSGGIRLETVRAYAEAGADIISSGALTHSASAADLALEFI